MIGYFFCEAQVDLRPSLYEATAMIEPEATNQVFVDFQGFRNPSAYLENLIARLKTQFGPCKVALGEGKLVAKAAALALTQPAQLVRCKTWVTHWGIWIRAQEQDKFLEQAPIDFLWCLPPDILKRLKTLGFSQIGQLKPLSLRVLESQFGAQGRAIYQYCRGVDPYPLRRWTPPRDFSIRQNFDLLTNENQLYLWIENMAQSLARELVQAQKNCRSLRIKFNYRGRVLARERQLSQGIWQSGAVQDLLWRMVQDVLKEAPEKVSELTDLQITAGDLQDLDYKQIELFSNPLSITTPPNLREGRLNKVVVHIQNKFQHGLCWGKEIPISRREAMLANWDPLRF